MNYKLAVAIAAVIVGVLTWFGVVPVTPHHGVGLIETTLGLLALPL